METSLLTTKLNIPSAQPQIVRRPRLIERLQQGLDYKLILVSAPAGFGKTTLISEWIRSSRPLFPTAWLSLEEGENDPIRFWDYFIAALKTLKPAAGEIALSLLHAPQPYSTESLLTALINDLTGIRKDFIVVLDDYHLILAEPVHNGIAFLLNHPPPKMHLIISTRVDPPLPLAHFRGKGALLEIRADDLRFSQEETTGLFAVMNTPPLSAESINTLNTKAEGWVVGLKMAALSIQREKDIPAFIAGFTGSQRYIMDYLIDEVLQRQPEKVLDFLLKTSVLEQLSAPLCDYVTGHGGGQEMLEKLESDFGGFLVALDQSGDWYRYHQLFAELLRHRLEVESGKELVANLQKRASQWCDDHGFPENAVSYALVCRDWETAMRLICAQGMQLIQQNKSKTLLDWLQVIPGELLRTNPRLYLIYASALVDVDQLKLAEAILSYLEKTAQGDADFQGDLAFCWTLLARKRGDIPRSIKMAEKTLSLLPQDNLKARTRVSFWLGFVRYQSGLLKEAMPLLKDAYEMGRKAEEQSFGTYAATYLGVTLWMRGRLCEALEMVQHSVDMAGQSPVAALPRSVLATLLYDRNDLEESARSARLSIGFCQYGGMPMVLLDSCFWLARTRLVRGDIAGAKAAMEKMDQAARLPGVAPDFCAYHAAWHVLFAIRQDDMTSALEWGSQLQEYANVLPFDASYVPARLLIARGEKTLAAEQLRSLYEKAIRAGAQGLVIWFCVYQALAAGTIESAVEFLTEALKIAEPEGYIRTFVDEGKLLKPLLEKALAQKITPGFTRKLLDIIETEEYQRRIRKGEVSTSSLTRGPLSVRELEVLQLIEQGLSNRQIAGKLFISLSTAKSHIHNITEKLEARSRTQAVARARELKLI